MADDHSIYWPCFLSRRECSTVCPHSCLSLMGLSVIAVGHRSSSMSVFQGVIWSVLELRKVQAGEDEEWSQGRARRRKALPCQTLNCKAEGRRWDAGPLFVCFWPRRGRWRKERENPRSCPKPSLVPASFYSVSLLFGYSPSCALFSLSPPTSECSVGIARALEGTVMTNSVKVMIKYRRFRLHSG